MILFRTKFKVNDVWKVDDFVSFFFDYCFGDYELETSYNDESDFESKLKNDSGLFYLLKTDTKAAIRMIMVDGSVSIIDTYVYDNTSALLFAERTKEFSDSLNDKFCSPVPNLIKPFFWAECSGFDGDLPTDNRSLIIRSDNIDLGKQLFLDKLNFINPVVYVSCNKDTGNYSVNYEYLASELAGMAHVLVEGSPFISDILSKNCSDYKLGTGSVLIFMPNGECEVFEPNNVTNLNVAIRKCIVKSLISISPGNEFNFDRIRERFVLNKLKSLSENNELSQIYEDILSDKDKELADIKLRLTDLEHENSNLKFKCSSIQSNLNNFKDVNSDNLHVSLNVTEADLYENEVRDVILKLINKEYKAMSGDKNTKRCRKAVILKNIIDNNTLSGKDDEIKNAFKSIMSKGDVSSVIISDLKRIGFSATLESNKHYSLIFNNDDRFKTFLPSSRSDYRGVDNMISDFMNTLFGY